MQNHTATPWRYKDYNSFALIESVKPYKLIHRSDIEGSLDSGESKANAEYIVHCVNSHEALVEACKSVRKAYQDMFDIMPVAFQTYDNILEEALKQAGEV